MEGCGQGQRNKLEAVSNNGRRGFSRKRPWRASRVKGRGGLEPRRLGLSWKRFRVVAKQTSSKDRISRRDDLSSEKLTEQQTQKP